MPSAMGWSANSSGGPRGPSGPDDRSPARPPAGLALHDPDAIRHAGRELLSLALIDSRNHLLVRLASDESAPALRLCAHAGWYQEYWIARHLQRQRGAACDPHGPRLAGIEPRIDGWIADSGDNGEPPAPDALRAYLAETLEVTLELLALVDEHEHEHEQEGEGEGAPSLHHYRHSLLHEDRLVEALDVLLQQGAPPARPQRAALWVPARRLRMGSAPGSAPGGLVPHNELGEMDVTVPEFEIDAQAVNWSQFAEFAADGGYDRRECWSEAGWAWLQARADGGDGGNGGDGGDGPRRAPRHVEQLGTSVLVRRGAAGVQRAPAGQAAMHLTRHEAEAWCHWAGRRLPTEPEWQLAAATAGSRGHVWGDVFEWVLGSARAWPGAPAAPPGCLDVTPAPGTQGVLRGASFATLPRRRNVQARRYAAPAEDRPFFGFRSCAV